MTNKGVLLAAAAAALFAAGTIATTATAQSGGVKCAGANSCKGTSASGTHR